MTKAKNIPKKIYFYWGNEKMSWLRYMTLYSFRKLNPKWKMYLYFCPPNGIKTKIWSSPEVQDFFMYKGEDYFSKIKELDIEILEWDLFHPSDPKSEKWKKEVGPTHKSNFFKWSKLAKDGGIYSDLDVLYLKPINKFYKQIKSYDTAICYYQNYFSIGLLGSKPKNPFYNDLFLNGFKTVQSSSYQSAGVQNLYNLLSGEKPSENKWKTLINKYPDNEFINFGMKVVYPYQWNQMGQVFKAEKKSLPEKCIGIHWYAGTEIAQKFNNLLSKETYKDYNNTISYFLQEILEK